jgi:hypothetical protein
VLLLEKLIWPFNENSSEKEMIIFYEEWRSAESGIRISQGLLKFHMTGNRTSAQY